jgi:uncharacterized membrane protein YbhN (UPF0104 family)
MDRVMPSRVIRLLVTAGTVAVTAATLFAMARGSSPQELLHALRSADGWLLALGVLPALALNQLSRTGRFGHLLRGPNGDRPRFAHLLSAVVLSQAANNVLPLRAGEAVRTRETVVRGVPLARVVSAQVLEKTLEVVLMVLVVAPVFAVGASRHVPAVPLVLGGVVLLVAAVLTLRLRGKRAWLARVTDWSRGDLARSIAWALVADAAEILVIALTARSVGLKLGIAGSIAVLGSVNLAILLPSTPANLGTLECGAVVALLTLGVPQESVLAFALVYRLVQFVPITLGGAAILAARAIPAVVPRVLRLPDGQVRPHPRVTH